jgi:release factor glutamine methyltransferase
MLADRLMRERLGPGTRVLDLCSGSGLLAVTAALHGASEVSAVDVSRRAIATIRLNALLNGVRVAALRGDLFCPVGAQRFDLVVSNPPYVPNERDVVPQRGASRAWEAGRTGRSFIDRICAEAGRHLREQGVLLIVHSSVCGEQQTLDALRAGGLHASVVARRRGALGPRLAARAQWLRRQGMLLPDGSEELVVFRAAR